MFGAIDFLLRACSGIDSPNFEGFLDFQPLHGARSKTPMYNAFYVLTSPLLSIARKLLPKYVLSTEEIGLAMLEVARHGAPKSILETVDIRGLVKG